MQSTEMLRMNISPTAPESNARLKALNEHLWALLERREVNVLSLLFLLFLRTSRHSTHIGLPGRFAFPPRSDRLPRMARTNQGGQLYVRPQIRQAFRSRFDFLSKNTSRECCGAYARKPECRPRLFWLPCARFQSPLADGPAYRDALSDCLRSGIFKGYFARKILPGNTSDSGEASAGQRPESAAAMELKPIG